MADKIFINYRREDSIGTAGRLRDRLAEAFGEENLFMDVDNIPAGVDFVADLNSQVGACRVFLAVIGPNWLDAKDESGVRRLDNPDDFVTIEIAAALARDIRVIPVLVDNSRMPKADKLPESIRPLVRRNAVEVRNSQFRRDAETLVARMRDALAPRRLEALGEEAAKPGRWRVRAIAGVATVAVLLLAGWAGYAFFQHIQTTIEQTVEQREAEFKAALERQAGAAAEAEEKSKADEAERQRVAAVKAEQERQARAAAEAEAEAKRKAEASSPQRLTKADVVKLFARFRLILERVRTDYVEPPDEQKLLLGAIQGMSALPISNAGVASTARNVGGTIDIDAVYDIALSILNARTTESDEAGLAQAAIKGLFAVLDPHSSYMDPKSFRDVQTQTRGEFGGLGIEVTMEDGLIKVVAPIDETPAAKAGIMANDIITKLDDEQVQGLTLNQAVEKMRGPVDTKIKLTITRKGQDKPVEVSITRDIIRVRSVRSQSEGDDVGYIRLTQFNEQTTEGLKKAITDITAKISDDKLKGYVLDLRNNPGGLLDQAISVSDAFLQKGEIVSTRGRNAEETQRFNARPGDATKSKPLIVLINGGTAAASEILAGALQDNKRATIIGTRSFGKGSVQTIIPLGSGNGALRLTTARYFTPSGRSIQAKGISPDIEVLQEVPDELKSKTDTKGEASLRGHLKGDEGKEQTGSQSYIPPEAKNDKALNMALDLLRGIRINSAFPPS